MAHRFEVVYVPEPDGSAWNVSIPAVDGCFTYGRSLKEARRNIRECLGLFQEQLGPDAAKIAAAAEFDESFRVPAKVRAAVRRYHKARERAEQLREASVEAARVVAEGLSLRDAGELLGMSPEGVRKLKAS